jgi:MFS transporter, DHA1 family, multidrug resistance protein
MNNWKRNLIIIWIAQFCSLMGFSLALPFSPFFIQQLGVTDSSLIKFWSSVSSSVVALSLAFAAPVWGMLADRYGRKKMMLRAYFSATIILGVMAFSPNVHFFVFMRFLQGFFTGTISAAMTFVAGSTPENRQGTAMGALSAGVFAGNMAGPMIGGVLADLIGYRQTFLVSSVLLSTAGFLVLFLVREQFVRPEQVPVLQKMSWRQRISALGPGGPILLLMLFMQGARMYDGPIFPLYVQQIHGKLEGASRLTGLISGIAAVGAALAGLILGRLSDRVSTPLIGKFSAVGAGILVMGIGLFPVIGIITPIRLMLSFCAGGLDPVFQVWLSRVTPPQKRGTIFGWGVTARSIGWALAQMLSGAVTVAYGFTWAYFVNCLLYLSLVPLIHWIAHFATREEPSIESGRASTNAATPT